ncbi:MAG: sulfate adenylyltransferase subunit CysD [Methylococcaceae bacterium]
MKKPPLPPNLALLEAESIFILREVAAECERPALLYSGGKDSAVALHLAGKAFFPGGLPFPLLHIDTGHNYPEVIAYRDQMAERYQATLVIRTLEDSITRGTVTLRDPLESRNAHQSVTLLEAIAELELDACIGGARRDEEKARAKERVFSFRSCHGAWDPKNQRPELWNLFNTRTIKGENIRVFPISNWTEMDVWQYIRHESIPLPSIYFSHLREVVMREDLLVPVTPLTPAREGEIPVRLSCRFRTVGDITCTAPIASNAHTIEAIILETMTTKVTERGSTRLDDKSSSTAMEQRKKAGYF